MNWDAIGAVGEIVGALAVVISIVYLALQIRQNSRLVRSSGYQTAVQTANHFLESLSSNPETLKVFQTAQESYADLSDDDQVLARTLFLQLTPQWCQVLPFARVRSKGNSGDSLLNLLTSIAH